MSTQLSSDAAGTEFLEEPEEEELFLPIYRCTNQRSIVKPEQIDLNEIAHKSKANNIVKQHQSDQMPSPVPNIALPLPKYPLTLMWNPAVINFELQYNRVVNRLRLLNSCIRPIYLQIYGLWDQSARLGASWCCRPRTRMFLAPGMVSYLVITATPRKESPIPQAHIGLQLTATHMRDTVVGYFVVPMKVKFLNYKSIIDCTEECTTVFNHAEFDDGSKGIELVVTDTDGSTFNK